ncbi:MAG TPA: ferritin-like protein [Solirubrobacteraceae bacterium]
MATSISDLLDVQVEDRDLDWLQTSLQNAIELEFATIPVYLSGMWSIIPQSGQTKPSGEAYNLILSVVMEEMLHLGLACNMLAATPGGSPEIVAPTYPSQGLPGGVLPELEVYLAGLSPETLQMYMAIEQPEPPADQVDPQSDGPTIGQFYDAIASAFASIQPTISKANQVNLFVSVPDPDHPEANPPTSIGEKQAPLGSLQDVQNAITLIKDQGEGTSTSPYAPQYDGGGELSHYFRFGEILHGQKLVQVLDSWEYGGDPVPFPDCYPVAPVPQGGYPDVPAPAQIAEFDKQYQKLLTDLGTWTQASLQSAIGAMLGLYQYVPPIVSQALPGGTGNYGPDFVPANAAS